MPHPKGVSHKSDKKILETLLINKAGLSWSDLKNHIGLDKNTLSNRLKILSLPQGFLIRKHPKGKHGHHILYLIPWSKYEQAYYYVYKKPSEEILRFKKDIETWFSKSAPIKEVSISKDMKITIKLNPRISALVRIHFSEDFQKFLNTYEWIKDSDAPVMAKYLQYKEGNLCPECLKTHFPKPIILVPDGSEKVCPECGIPSKIESAY